LSQRPPWRAINDIHLGGRTIQSAEINPQEALLTINFTDGTSATAQVRFASENSIFVYINDEISFITLNPNTGFYDLVAINGEQLFSGVKGII